MCAGTGDALGGAAGPRALARRAGRRAVWMILINVWLDLMRSCFLDKTKTTSLAPATEDVLRFALLCFNLITFVRKHDQVGLSKCAAAQKSVLQRTSRNQKLRQCHAAACSASGSLVVRSLLAHAQEAAITLRPDSPLKSSTQSPCRYRPRSPSSGAEWEEQERAVEQRGTVAKRCRGRCFKERKLQWERECSISPTTRISRA